MTQDPLHKLNLTRKAMGYIAYIGSILLMGACSHTSLGPQVSELNNSSCLFQDGMLIHGARNRPQIALTFDACPTSKSPQFDSELFEWLQSSQTPATVFVSGTWALDNTSALSKLDQLPDVEIALHGHHHPRLQGLTTEQLENEITEGADTLKKLGVQALPVFRPPYWDNSTNLVEAMERAEVTGLKGDVALGDPSPTRTAQNMEQDALRWTLAGSIVLLHINGRGVHTTEAVRNFVPALKDRGFQWVKVSELLDYCDQSTPAKTDEETHTKAIQESTSVWNWGSDTRSAEVPFLRLSTDQTNPKVTLYNPLKASFNIKAHSVAMDSHSLSFSYPHPFLAKTSTCVLTMQSDQRLSGTCIGERRANEWGEMQVDLWLAQ